MKVNIYYKIYNICYVKLLRNMLSCTQYITLVILNSVECFQYLLDTLSKNKLNLEIKLHARDVISDLFRL